MASGHSLFLGALAASRKVRSNASKALTSLLSYDVPLCLAAFLLQVSLSVQTTS
jgi:hypothetical protein